MLYSKNKITMVLWQCLKIFKTLKIQKAVYMHHPLYYERYGVKGYILKQILNSAQKLGDCLHFVCVCDFWSINSIIFKGVFCEITVVPISSWENILWVVYVGNGISEIRIFAF